MLENLFLYQKSSKRKTTKKKSEKKRNKRKEKKVKLGVDFDGSVSSVLLETR